VATTEDDLRFNYVSKAAQVLPPITQDLVDALGLEGDPAHIAAVEHALARAFMEGTAAGAAEATAQATEMGIPLGLNSLGSPGKS